MKRDIDYQCHHIIRHSKALNVLIIKWLHINCISVGYPVKKLYNFFSKSNAFCYETKLIYELF